MFTAHALARWAERRLRGDPEARMRRARFRCERSELIGQDGVAAEYHAGAAAFRLVVLPDGTALVLTVCDCRDGPEWKAARRRAAQRIEERFSKRGLRRGPRQARGGAR